MSAVSGTPATNARIAREQAPSRTRRPMPEAFAGLLFIAPGLVLITLFFLLPFVMTLWMSLHAWPLLGHPHFIGLRNYGAMLHDQAFWHDVAFTVEYTAVITAALFGLAFPLTLFVAQPRRGIGVLRTAYFLPAVIGLPSASLLWVWLLNDDSGLVSPLAERLHLAAGPLAVLTSTNLTFLAVIVMVTWKMTGFTMMMLLPGLQAIPGEIDEAASMDGANGWQRFRFITLPLMRPTLAMALLVSITGSMLAFDQFYIISNGGPENATMTAVYRIFNTSFVSFHLGYGAALSVALLLLLVVINFAQVILLRAPEE